MHSAEASVYTGTMSRVMSDTIPVHHHRDPTILKVKFVYVKRASASISKTTFCRGNSTEISFMYVHRLSCQGYMYARVHMPCSLIIILLM